MSRTHHHRTPRWLVKNSYYKKLLHIWGDDFTSKKGKQRWLSRLAKAKQKRLNQKEIKENK